MSSLPLTTSIQVNINVTPTAAPRRGFNLGLIIGTSNVISAATRVVVYSSTAAMLTAGFSANSVEYLAAQLYFSSPSQPTQVAIGRQATGETPLQAITACRAANNQWYTAYVPGAVDADHTAIAAWCESATPTTTYFAQTNDAAVLNNTGGNLFLTLSASKYTRTMGVYSTFANGTASIMGYAMGATSDLDNSAYTLKFKQMPGVTPEALTTQQVTNIETNYGNVYVARGGYYDWFENGNMFDGSWFDQKIYLDKLGNEITLNVSDLLYGTNKIPQTEAGMSQLKSAVAVACAKMRRIGFIAPGQWNGSPILTLATGNYLPKGYLVLSDSINGQPQANRSLRQAPAIYVPIKLAGAVQDVLIQVNVNQ